jgi:uncharacterized membrane protein
VDPPPDDGDGADADASGAGRAPDPEGEAALQLDSPTLATSHRTKGRWRRLTMSTPYPPTASIIANVMSEPEQPVDVRRGTSRLEAFSDGVMAVIITILALELHVPAGPHLADVKAELPSLFIYVLAFSFIALYWNNHHHLMRATERISGGVMWANMVLLFFLSLIPVVTEWLRPWYDQEGLPAASFGIVGLAAALSFTALVRTIIHANGRDSVVARAIASDLKGYISLAMYAVAVVFAFVNVWIAYALYAAVAVVWVIPDRRFSRMAEAD